MEFMVEEEEDYWKCRKHPLQPRHGVCPICLNNRLILLCPNCANVRPCACFAPNEMPSSSSSSSSSSLSSAAEFSKSGTGVGSVGRISYLINSELAMRRTRSAAFQFLRSKPGENDDEIRPLPKENRSRSSFWSFFKSEKTKKVGEAKKTTTKLPRSRSVGFACYSDPRKVSGSDVRLKGWSLHLPSPSKVFRLPKTAKVVHERSPLYRG